MAIKVSRTKRFLEEGRVEGEKELVVPSVGEYQIGWGMHIKKREQRGVAKREVDLYIIRVGIKQRKREGRKFT